MKKANRQKGLSLIELMIAMVVSLVLMAGIGTVYMSSKRNYQARDQLSLMDENARVALNALTKHLEHTGYAATAAGVFPLPTPFVLTTPVAGTCSDGGSNINTASTLNVTADDASTTPAQQTGRDTVGIAYVGDDALFIDCGNTEGNSITLSDTRAQRLKSLCKHGAAANVEGSLIYNTFSIGYATTPEKDSLGVSIPNLYCSGSVSANKQSVAQGVDAMQFMYGVDADGNDSVDQYLTATQVTTANAWDRVISIKVALLMRSIEPVLPVKESKTYRLLDKDVVRDDRYQHVVYNTVIQLRNRVDG
ncbi:PilW family protein [Thiothrix litoralis]|uniref:PilW family protein n=1 Tax=Thiothrix litoralis TaxID=2891210 RepID=A0ABX7WU68_9GAMM|nr:PilW family protein [Thiothrix litoralis]QTR46782.1 PilW family protein [Thiothrix litoralis]